MNRREFLKGVGAAAALMCCPVVVGEIPKSDYLNYWAEGTVSVAGLLRRMHLIVTWRSGGLSHVKGRDVMIAGPEHLRAIEELLKDGHRRGFYEDYTMVEVA